MRIIAGDRRGKRLITLDGLDVRPTSERVKEAVFNILQFSIEGRTFLDLFAGCGQMGLEALSRGARAAVFVDSSKASLKVIRQNIGSSGLGERAEVQEGSFDSYLRRCNRSFDLAFIDPPYQAGLYEQALQLTEPHMNPGGTIVCEHPTGLSLPQRVGSFATQKTYKYGKVSLTLYRREEQEDGA